jgi:hypothetical protein
VLSKGLGQVAWFGVWWNLLKCLIFNALRVWLLFTGFSTLGQHQANGFSTLLNLYGAG